MLLSCVCNLHTNYFNRQLRPVASKLSTVICIIMWSDMYCSYESRCHVGTRFWYTTLVFTHLEKKHLHQNAVCWFQLIIHYNNPHCTLQLDIGLPFKQTVRTGSLTTFTLVLSMEPHSDVCSATSCSLCTPMTSSTDIERTLL